AGLVHTAEETATKFVLNAMKARDGVGGKNEWVGLDENGAATVVGMCVRHGRKWGAPEGFGDRVLEFWKVKRPSVGVKVEGLLEGSGDGSDKG
ncbi:hypothetical protein HK097_003491, partial [Rhizophlyctis rosea]